MNTLGGIGPGWGSLWARWQAISPTGQRWVCVLLWGSAHLFWWVLWAVPRVQIWQQTQAQEQQAQQNYRQRWLAVQQLAHSEAALERIAARVAELEEQLPRRSEMDRLLAGLTQAGVGRSLRFVSFKPGPEHLRTEYAEQAIELRFQGRYDDIGGFFQDVAQLPRMVVLETVQVDPVAGQSGWVQVTAQAKTFRLLDAHETKRVAPPDTESGESPAPSSTTPGRAWPPSGRRPP